MPRDYDAIVLGLGAMGSAALWRLARAGQRVLGIDRWPTPHAQGSTHGESRMTRLAQGEGPACTAMVLRANALWRELEADTGRSLLVQTGGLVYGDAGATAHGVAGFLEQTIAVARQFDIPHALLDAPALRRRFPLFRFRDGDRGYVEPGSGYLRPEACVRTMLDAASAAGAETLTARLRGIESRGAGITIDCGDTVVSAPRVVACLGPWTAPLLGAPFTDLLRVYPQFLAWFPLHPTAAPPTAAPPTADPAALPVWIHLPGPGEEMVYGFPLLDHAAGLKVATEQFDQTCDPELPHAPIDPARIARLAADARRVLPLAERPSASVSCLYTVTPDHTFIIDRHPGLPGLVVVSACSGHGFKHASAIGDAAADLALDRDPVLDLRPFRLSRFA